MRQRTYGGVGSPAREGGLTRLKTAFRNGLVKPITNLKRYFTLGYSIYNHLTVGINVWHFESNNFTFII